MLKNHLIVAWRNIKKNMAYSALNVLGLAVGLAVSFLTQTIRRPPEASGRRRGCSASVPSRPRARDSRGPRCLCLKTMLTKSRDFL